MIIFLVIKLVFYGSIFFFYYGVSIVQRNKVIIKNVNRNISKKYLPDLLIGKYEKELNTILNPIEISKLRKILFDIYNQDGESQVHSYMSFVLEHVRTFNTYEKEMDFELVLTNKLFNNLSEDGKNLSDINPQLLLLNLIKINNILEQNDEIIKLLKEIRSNK